MTECHPTHPLHLKSMQTLQQSVISKRTYFYKIIWQLPSQKWNLNSLLGSNKMWSFPCPDIQYNHSSFNYAISTPSCMSKGAIITFQSARHLFSSEPMGQCPVTFSMRNKNERHFHWLTWLTWTCRTCRNIFRPHQHCIIYRTMSLFFTSRLVRETISNKSCPKLLETTALYVKRPQVLACERRPLSSSRPAHQGKTCTGPSNGCAILVQPQAQLPAWWL